MGWLFIDVLQYNYYDRNSSGYNKTRLFYSNTNLQNNEKGIRSLFSPKTTWQQDFAKFYVNKSREFWDSVPWTDMTKVEMFGLKDAAILKDWYETMLTDQAMLSWHCG